MPTSTMTTQGSATHARLLLVMSLDPGEIGHRIAEARAMQGWTQMEFALHANVSMSSVARWEAGKLPPVRELVRIAGVLEIDPVYLVEGEAVREASVEPSNSEIRDELAAIRSLLEDVLHRRQAPEAIDPPVERLS